MFVHFYFWHFSAYLLITNMVRSIFFVHDNTCAQCQFMQQTENAQIPDIIELCEIDCQYSEIPLANLSLVCTEYFDSYLAQAPPSLI